MIYRKLFLLLAIPFLVAGAAAQQPPKKKPAPPKTGDLFKDVKLPPGDPIPDFVEPPWVPPNPDKSKMNKRGTDFGPCLAFTVQLDKKTFIRRGLTVRLPREHSILYDLDTMSVAATWRGGFIDISKTHYEDNKGKLPGRPGAKEVRWAVNTPGWADAKGSFADPRPNKLGPLPHVKFRGYFLHGYRAVLSYSVNGRDVLEMPGVDKNAPPGCVSRTFHVAAGKQPIKLLVFAHEKASEIAKKKGSLPTSTIPAGKRSQLSVVHVNKNDRIAIGEVHYPKGSVLTVGGMSELTIPASAKPLNFKIVFFYGNKEDIPNLDTYLQKNESVADLRNYVRGGPPRWKTPVVVKGKRGEDNGPYVVDSLGLPSKNPWKSWIRPAAFDFFSDGRLAMSSMNGDVWICHGIDKNLHKLTWRRYATGLYEPLGLKIVADKLYVLGRDRITRLHDLNRDGEADYYQTFWADSVVAPGYHAFTFDLQTDSKGNFYFLKSGRKVDKTPGHNALVKVSADGKHYELVVTGFRHPNGMGIGPHDEIVVGDNQGEFIPSSKINLIHKGAYYGYGHFDADYARPLLWLPIKQDNSCGGQVWAPQHWGPLSGKMLHTSYGTCKLFYVLTQFDHHQPVQATAIPLPFTFSSGIMRGRIHPKDGQLYLSGLRGWGTKAKADGCLNRVRYTGKPAYMVKNVTLVRGGIRLDFTCAVDPKSARQRKNYKIEQWNYIYSKKYGSPEMSVLHPGQKGHDTVAVKSVRMGKDGRSVMLEVPQLRPVDQLHVVVEVRSRAGHDIKADLFTTIHRLVGKVKR